MRSSYDTVLHGERVNPDVSHPDEGYLGLFAEHIETRIITHQIVVLFLGSLNMYISRWRDTCSWLIDI